MIFITADSTKDFMAKLLVSDVFDDFKLQEANIITSVIYTIGGRIHPEFFSDDERENITGEFIPWKELKHVVFGLIKGKNPPVSFRMTLLLDKAQSDALIRKKSPEGANTPLRALVINIRFENGTIGIVTGTSYDSFVADKSADEIWDKAFCEFLVSKDIAFTLPQ